MLINIVFTCLNIAVIVGLDDLSMHKNASQKSISLNCMILSDCEASNAVDRNNGTCTKADNIGTTSQDTFTWWYVDLGEILSVSTINIYFKDYGSMYEMRQRGRFAGFSLFVSNTTNKDNGFLCYENGSELPPLDNTISCRKHGRFVIFYNERLGGTNYPVGYETTNVITELCEVMVTGCSMLGVYGNNCDKQCPENCQQRRCDIINGTCLGCIPGWIGEYCEIVCPAGSHGLECSTECVEHCKDEPCNHTTGHCDKGCSDGWTGEHCDKECQLGTYGPDCTHNCSSHCIDDVACNRVNGNCDRGCKPGYTGPKCDKGCVNGMFGINCRNRCSLHCLHNGKCNSTNGFCFDGCSSGYFGYFCNETCMNGRYGVNCSQNCSTNCSDEVCDHVDGSCPCKTGWKESDCSQVSDQQWDDISCNTSPLIVGLTISMIINALLLVALLTSIKRYLNQEKKMRSLQYATVTSSSPRPQTDSNEVHHYQELNVAGNAYDNLALRN